MIAGATSSIAQQAARIWASSSAEFFLVGRNDQRLAAVAEDLRVRGSAAVNAYVLDLNHSEAHEPVIRHAIEAMGGIDIALVAHGTLPDQAASEASVQNTFEALETNFLSVVSLLTHLANYFEEMRSGTIAVISSVAGDRGRKANYVYGAAKGGTTVFLQGLRNRLYVSGVHVLTIKPGFVDTPMTAQFSKNSLWASSEKVGRAIVRAVDRQADVVYVPWFWRPIMALIRTIPESIFKKMDLR